MYQMPPKVGDFRDVRSQIFSWFFDAFIVLQIRNPLNEKI